MRVTVLAALFVLLSAMAGQVVAAVLPQERGDVLYHSYDGGGVTIDGPSILLRKNVGDSVSVGFNHYVDNVTSASIDVEVSASEYTEERQENSIFLDYLRQKTTMSLGYTTSSESDYDATTISVGISQDMFGDLTTVSMGFSYGDNEIGQNGDPDFEEFSEARSYRLGLTQILTKKLVTSIAYENITDQGFLNNPYRQVRYADSTVPVGYSFQPEVYPETRTSSALALRANYYLERRAALHTGVRFFNDNWGIESLTLELAYTFPYAENWIFEGRVRYYDQSGADFYSDLYPFRDAQNHLARDKELSEFDSITLGGGLSYELGTRGWESIERASLNLDIDFIQFDYADFRDLTQSGSVGNEPLYSFDATVIRAFASIWF
jgi:hypothetical protein